MRKIDKIIIHCSDTPKDMDIGAKEIRDWHIERGWNDIGYHYVIRRSGLCEFGRPEEKVGAHVAGHNESSIGVCLVGGKPDCNFTRQQWFSLDILICNLTRKYPEAIVMGHNDLTDIKRCPCFDAKAWWNTNQERKE